MFTRSEVFFGETANMRAEHLRVIEGEWFEFVLRQAGLDVRQGDLDIPVVRAEGGVLPLAKVLDERVDLVDFVAVVKKKEGVLHHSKVLDLVLGRRGQKVGEVELHVRHLPPGIFDEVKPKVRYVDGMELSTPQTGHLTQVERCNTQICSEFDDILQVGVGGEGEVEHHDVAPAGLGSVVEAEAQEVSISTAAAQAEVVAEVPRHVPGPLLWLGVPAARAIEARLIQWRIPPTFRGYGCKW